MTLLTTVKRFIATQSNRRREIATRSLLADLPQDVQRDIGVRRSGVPIDPMRRPL